MPGDHRGHYDAIVVGGGFFGASLAAHLQRERRLEVIVIDAADDLLQRASYGNQARVHNGYHYPRSILTGLRSRVNFTKFVEHYEECVVDDFEAYYGIARRFSKVLASQFELFCSRIGASFSPAPARIRRLFDADTIEDVYTVREYAFDAEKLKRRARRDLDMAGVEVRLRTEAQRVEPDPAGLRVACREPGASYSITGERVYNCTYSRINQLLAASDLPTIPLKHEVTEIALVEPPDEFRDAAITVMCGPFFSLMPFPARGLHSFSHVRYTPHCEWYDPEDAGYADPYARLEAIPKKTAFDRMRRDARRFMPCIDDARYVDSIFEVKTVLPISERDDSRPILFVEDQGIDGLTCIMGGKIDNIFDMIDFEEQSRARAAPEIDAGARRTSGEAPGGEPTESSKGMGS